MTGPLGQLLSLVSPPLCWACGRPARTPDPLCAACRAGLSWPGPELVTLAGVECWAPLAYAGAAAALVRALKYRGAAGLADPMAARVVANAPRGMLDPPAALVPVPLHPARLRRRGFNQAALLAEAIARRSRLVVFDCLERSGPATRQVGRGRAERTAGAALAVGVRHGRPVPPRAVLVDDVVTTGATVAACAAALRRSGARQVSAVAFARTPGR